MLCWNTGWRNFILGLMEHCFVPHVKSYMVAAENWSIRCFAWRTARGRQGIWMPPGSCLSGAKAWLAMTAASTTTARAHGVASQCLRPSPCGRPCTATDSFCPQRNAPRGRPVCWPTGNGCTAISAPGSRATSTTTPPGPGRWLCWGATMTARTGRLMPTSWRSSAWRASALRGCSAARASLSTP